MRTYLPQMASLGLMVICLSANYPLLADSSQGLVAYFPLNGNGADASGNGHNGVVVAAMPTDNRLGQAGQALLFDGTNSYVSIPDATELRLSTTDFTITAWILEKERDPHYSDCIISKRGPTGPGLGRPGDGRGWIISVLGLRHEASTGHVVYQVSGGQDPSAMTTGVLSLNQWHHVAVVYHRDKSTLDFYLDGAWDSTSDGVPPPNPEAKADMHIGNDSQLAYNNAYVFHGKISDVRISDHALTAEDLARLYDNGLLLLRSQLTTGAQRTAADNGSGPQGIQFTGRALTRMYGGLVVGQQIIVESSPDLIHWTPIQTNIVTSATMSLTNLINPAANAEFFRISVP
jgi:hypothetical protein